MRDFVYIRDCTAIMIWLLDHPDISGIFNIGSGEARSFNDLVNATFAALNLKPAINYVPMPEHLQGRYQYHTRAEMAKLRTAGFHKPMTPLEEGVGDYVRNYLDAETPYYDLQSIHKKINHKDF